MTYNVFSETLNPTHCSTAPDITKVPFQWEHLLPMQYMFPRPTCLRITNCIWIGSAVFAQPTAERPYTLQCALQRD